MRENGFVAFALETFFQRVGDFDFIFDDKNTHGERLGTHPRIQTNSRVRPYFTIAVRTCGGFEASVQAITISSPERTRRGNAPEPTPLAPDTFVGAAAVPAG